MVPADAGMVRSPVMTCRSRYRGVLNGAICRSELARDLAQSGSILGDAARLKAPQLQFYDSSAADREQAHSYGLRPESTSRRPSLNHRPAQTP